MRVRRVSPVAVMAVFSAAVLWAAPGTGSESGNGAGLERWHGQIWDAEIWSDVVDAAAGQTVYFHAWGGSETTNAYLDWVADTVAARYDIDMRHVRISDTADAVGTVLAEKAAGRDDDGAVDLVWINGENFAAMRENDLLGAPFAFNLPNFAYVDPTEKPTVVEDFTIPTDGLESPWGMAQLVFMADTAVESTPPTSIEDLLMYLSANPGWFTYPQPPDFLGVTFLKQALIELVDEPSALQEPVRSAEQFAEVTAPLWSYLDELHPLLWRRGEVFPANGSALIPLLDDREIVIALNFNPRAASAAIENGELRDTVRTFVFEGGTIGNSHFVAIPYNSGAREGAMVVANFLLSPEAQARKEDPTLWGDPTVLSMDLLDADDRAMFEALPRGVATLAPEELGTQLAEPHPSWTDGLQDAWAGRYER
ncbi:ABC transporter substrate-binding protein [Fodinicurvata sp. EGI_FJ10296]|uniref:ABC transporter substrate-binding protein n=1 Tax=Fodinicurvata sp. EGI_FJ10296 TaxID=3231908 RepID=UPI003453262A